MMEGLLGRFLNGPRFFFEVPIKQNYRKLNANATSGDGMKPLVSEASR
jgi:hypothetical protein